MPADITGETWERAPDTAIGYIDFECLAVGDDESGVNSTTGQSGSSIGRIFYPAEHDARGTGTFGEQKASLYPFF